MSLEDYKHDMLRCTRCSYCKWIPWEDFRNTDFTLGCPSVARYNWHTYSAGGKFNIALSLLEGRIALRRRDFDTAKDCFKQAIRSARTDPWAFYYLGTTCMRMGDLPEAIDILYEGEKYVSERNRIRGGVKNAIRSKLGVAYVLNGDLDPASKILEFCLETDPDHPETLFAFWLLKVRKEGIEKASEAFEVLHHLCLLKLMQYHLRL